MTNITYLPLRTVYSRSMRPDGSETPRHLLRGLSQPIRPLAEVVEMRRVELPCDSEPGDAA